MPPEKTQHPDWLAVGKTVLARRTNFLGRVDFERRGVVTKHTPKGVVLDGKRRFTLKDGSYVEVPRYLDYTNALVKPEDEAT